MGRRSKPSKPKPIQITFAFMRTSNLNQTSLQSRLQRSFLIDQQQQQQNQYLQYPVIAHCLQQFLKDHKLTREVKITYLNLEKENLEINYEFEIQYKVVRECYNSEFVVMVQTKVDHCSQKLHRVMIELNELCREVEEIKRHS